MTPRQKKVIECAKRYQKCYGGDLDIKTIAFALDESEYTVAHIIKRFFYA